MADTKAPSTAAVEYPSSDGRMIAELPKHGDAILYALATLRVWFARHHRVQVGAGMLLYYQEGDSTKRVTSDLFVARGLDSLPPSYKLWEAGRPPSFVLEVASPSTEDRDRGEKQALYASIGVKEYWRFHPTGLLEGARRAGTRLEGGTLQGLGYEPLATSPDGSVRSEVLGLDVRVDERPSRSHLLRFRDPETGKDLLTFEESEHGRLEAERWRREAERQQPEAERKRHEAERKQHEEERRRREAERAQQDAEAELARLRAEIARLESGQEGGSGSKA
ncbi:MAG: Uma2 family endonuclease [Bryobacterales bacterium]|nr:Uma2 family endonuclease [Bryobacterales bacterium]